MKTRRLGSRAGWRRMNTRRALATSGRSPACAGAGSARPRVGSFFERQVVGTQKPLHRAQSDGDPGSRKCAADFLQGQVGLPGNQLQHPRSVLAQPGATVATHHARARMALGPPALRPADGAADADVKPHRRCPCAAAQRHKTNHTLASGPASTEPAQSPPMAWSSLSLDNQQGPEYPSLYVST